MIQVVAALIKKDKKILLAQRIKGDLKGYWEFPGGKIEEKETKSDAIIREIKEELDVGVNVLHEIGYFEHTYAFATIGLTLFLCEITGDKEIKLMGSHEKLVWVDYNNNNLLLAPLDKKIFQYLKKNYVI